MFWSLFIILDLEATESSMYKFCQFFFFFMGTLCLHSTLAHARPTTITDVKVAHKDNQTYFILVSDAPLNKHPSMLGETVVMELPDDVVWEAPTSFDQGKGFVKNFSIARGDLEIHLKKNTALKSVTFDDKKAPYKTVFLFVKGDPTASFDIYRQQSVITEKKQVLNEYVITKLRVTMSDKDHTHIELTLNKPLTIKPKKIGDTLVLPLPDGTNVHFDRNEVKGHVTDVQHYAFKGDNHIAIQMKPDVEIAGWQAIPGMPARFVVTTAPTKKKKNVVQAVPKQAVPQDKGLGDLDRNNVTLADMSRVKAVASSVPPQVSQKFQVSPKLVKSPYARSTATPSQSQTPPPHAKQPQAMAGFLLQAEKASGVEKNVQAPQATPKKTYPVKQEISYLRIHEDQHRTMLILGIRRPETFRVIENGYTHQAMIKLPKMDWEKVHVEEMEGGAIEGYFVDQSHPKWTTLVLTLRPGTAVQENQVHEHQKYGLAFVVEFGEMRSDGHNWGRNVQYNWGQDIHRPIDKEDPTALVENDYPEKMNDDGTIVKANPFAYQTEKPYLNPGDEFQGGNAPFTNLGTGLYTGGFLSYAYGRNKVTSTLGANNELSYNRSMNGWGAGGFVGYGKGFSRFYVGIEGILQMLWTEGKMRVTNATESFFTKDETLWSYGAALRLGAYVSPESLFTIRLGAAGTLLRHKPGNNTTGQYGVVRKINQNMAGILYGFGLETALTGQWSLRVDYTHTDFQHFSKTTAVNNANQVGRLAPKLDQLMLGMAYKFEPMFGPGSPSDVGIVPTGWYVGTGVDLSGFTTNRSFSNTNNNTHFSMKSTTVAPMWNMYFGYGVQHGRGYFGIEGMSSFGTRHVTENVKINGVSESYQSKLNTTYGLYFRPGYVFGHGNLIYGRLGVVMGKYSRSASATNQTAFFTSGDKISKNVVALAIGGGMEAFISNNLSLRGEYIFELYQSAKSAQGGASDTINPSNSKIQLGVSYLF